MKVILVGALLKNQLWAYPWTIVLLGAFILYQVYRLSFQPSVGLAALTVFDAAIAWLTYREYRKQLALARRWQRHVRTARAAGRPGTGDRRRYLAATSTAMKGGTPRP